MIEQLCNKTIKIRKDGEDGHPEGFVHEMLEKGQTPEQLIEVLNSKIPK